MSKIKKNVPVEKVFELSADEKDELARQSMALTDEFDRLTEEFKDSRASYRKRLKDIKTNINDTNKAYREGLQKRTVPCEEHIDMESKRAVYVFDGQIISERELSMDELAQHGTAPLFEEPTESVQDIMREETNSKTKSDLVAK